MKLISIIAGAALLAGCAGVGDNCDPSISYASKGLHCDQYSYKLFEMPSRGDWCREVDIGKPFKRNGETLVCTAYEGWRPMVAKAGGDPEVDAKVAQEIAKNKAAAEWYEQNKEALQKAAEEEARKEALAREAREKKTLGKHYKCIKSFTRLIGTTSDGAQVTKSFVLKAKAEAYEQISQEYILKNIPSIDVNYALIGSVGYRSSKEFTEWRQKIGQKCSQALYYSQCMAANYVLAIDEESDAVIKNCKSK